MATEIVDECYPDYKNSYLDKDIILSIVKSLCKYKSSRKERFTIYTDYVNNRKHGRESCFIKEEYYENEISEYRYGKKKSHTLQDTWTGAAEVTDIYQNEMKIEQRVYTYDDYAKKHLRYTRIIKYHNGQEISNSIVECSFQEN